MNSPELLELYKGTAIECAEMATWLAIEMAGQHIQLKMDHPSRSKEWVLYYQISIHPDSMKDPRTLELPCLVKRFLSER